MATVTGLTAARMIEMEEATVIDGNVVGDDLILVTRGGTEIDAGNVRGPKGDKGDTGSLTQAQADIRYVNVNGDTMTGYLLLQQPQSTILESAVCRSFVDDNFVHNVGGVMTGPLRIEQTSDASFVSTAHGFQVGLTDSYNIIIDSNEIMARSIGHETVLMLNADGGPVCAGGGLVTSDGAVFNGVGTSVPGFYARTDGPILTMLSDSAGSTVSTVGFNQLRCGASTGGVGGIFQSFRRSASNDGSSAVPVGSIDINTGGSSIRYNTTSDRRLKNDHGPIPDAVARLKLLIPRRFSWKLDEDSTEMDGFFADEVTPAVPEAVSGEPDAIREDGGIDPQQLNVSSLVPLLVSALQEALVRIESLEAILKPKTA